MTGKESEEELKGFKNKYERIIKHLDIGYFKTDINGIILDHNPAVNKILGFELDKSLVGLSAKDFFGSIEEFNEYQKVMTKKGRLSGFIHSARNKNGETIFLHTHSHVYKNKEKNRFEVEGTVFDITEKFVLEQKLKESEEKYRNLFERAPFSIWLINFDGTIIDCNMASNSLISKIDVKNLIGKNLTDLYPLVKKFKKSLGFSKELISENIVSRLRVRMQTVIKGGVQEPIEFQYHRFDGKSLWVNLQSSLVKIGDKELIQVIIQDITERKNIEQELRESEKKYRNLIENTKDAIVIVGLDGKYKYISPQFSTMLGERKIILEDDIFSLIHPDDKKQLIDLFSQAVKQKSILNIEVEFRALHKDGHYIWVLTSTQNYYDDEGNIEGFITDLRDVTARKVAEQKLKESEEKYRLISENANDMIVVLNEKFEYEYINEKVHKEIMDFSKEDIIGKSALDFIHPNDIEKAANYLKDGFKTGEGVGEVRVRRKKGDYLLLESRGKIFIDKDGNRKGLLISRDITERKMAEQKLRESEEKYHDLFNSTPYAIWLVDLNGVLIDCNTTMNKFITVFKKDELIGKSFSEIIRLFLSKGDSQFKNLSSVFKEGFKLLLEQGFVDPFEFQITRADGKELWITLESSLVFVGNKKFVQIFIKDITERKEADEQLKRSEEELRSLNIELEKKVRERTKELEEKNIELKKLDRAKDDFITMAAHELKTPLISVAGYTDYILTKHIDDLTDDVKNDLLIVQRNIDRLQSLMNQLLDVMKIESRKIRLNLELTNISNIIYRCLHELNYLFKEKDHEMILNIDNEIFINIDPNRIFQVFSNLISNSTKFTPKGGKIEISAKKDVMHYLFKVKDNGIGLPEEDLDRIFKKFETVKNDDDSFQTGSGLGLYISKGFVEAHGGQMWATSEGLNKGMTIQFTIPC